MSPVTCQSRRAALIAFSAFFNAICGTPIAMAHPPRPPTPPRGGCAAARSDIVGFAQQLINDSAALDPEARDAFAARFAEDGFLTRFGTIVEGPFYKEDFKADGFADILFDPIKSQVGTVTRAFKAPTVNGNQVIAVTTEYTIEVKPLDNNAAADLQPVILYEAAYIELDASCKIKEWASYAPAIRLLEELSIRENRGLALVRGTINGIKFNSLEQRAAGFGQVYGPGVSCPAVPAP